MVYFQTFVYYINSEWCLLLIDLLIARPRYNTDNRSLPFLITLSKNFLSDARHAHTIKIVVTVYITATPYLRCMLNADLATDLVFLLTNTNRHFLHGL